MRLHKRRSSEGMVKVNFEPLFDEIVKPIAYLQKKKAALLKLNTGYDQPITRERLWNSMVWDEY